MKVFLVEDAPLLRERIAFLGGSLQVERAVRGGTRVRVVVPLQGLEEQSP